jgi:hypothetical protein
VVRFMFEITILIYYNQCGRWARRDLDKNSFESKGPDLCFIIRKLCLFGRIRIGEGTIFDY